MHLVDKTGAEVLLDRRRPTSEPHILAFCRFESSLERHHDAVVDEVEGGPTFHRDRWTRMVREHENGVMVGRVISPPTFPVGVTPGAADRAEHVATHDGGADALVTFHHESVIETLIAIGLTEHLTTGPGSENPFM
jgi:hypothetical protein